MVTALLVTALMFLVLGSTSPVAADHGGSHGQAPMVIQIRHADEVNLNPTISEPSYHPSSILEGSLTVRVDGVICSETTLPPVENRGDLAGQVVATILVGTPQQPAGCSREGAEVTFWNGRGLLLFETTTFEGGGLNVLTNFAPSANQPGIAGDGAGANSGPPVYLPGTGTGGLGGDGTGWMQSTWLVFSAWAAAALALGTSLVLVRRRR